MGVTLAFIPHCTNLTQLFILAGINGFSIGSFDTAINVWILEIWAEESGPFMQALHFTYGIGSFVAPLICEPFLSSESIHTGGHGIPPLSTTTPGSVPVTTLLPEWNATLANGTDGELPSIDPIDFLIYVPYAIAGAITVISALVVLVLYYVKKYEPPVSEKSSRQDAKCAENGKS